MAVIGPDGEAVVVKDAVSVDQLIRRKRTKDALALPASVILGHTRYATVGDRNDRRNAHPFRAGDIVGVHNGTIQNADVWAGILRLPRFGETDSEVAIRMFAKEAISHRLGGKSVAKVAGRIEGNAAFALVDMRNPEVVYLTTNAGLSHTLYFVHDERLGGVFFASTTAILAAGLGYRVADEATRIKAGEVFKVYQGRAKRVARFTPIAAPVAQEHKAPYHRPAVPPFDQGLQSRLLWGGDWR